MAKYRKLSIWEEIRDGDYSSIMHIFVAIIIISGLTMFVAALIKD